MAATGTGAEGIPIDAFWQTDAPPKGVRLPDPDVPTSRGPGGPPAFRLAPVWQLETQTEKPSAKAGKRWLAKRLCRYRMAEKLNLFGSHRELGGPEAKPT